jgi:hypothetical protein
VEATQVKPRQAAGESTVGGVPRSLADELRRWLRTIRRGTVIALGVAVVAVGLTWLDPSAGESEAVMMVSTNSAARRVFPTLADEDSGKATIELQPAGQPLIRMVPEPDGGHQLMRGEARLGPVDPEAFEGLWSSLRMGTALRPVDRGAKVRTNTRGFIRVALPHTSLTLELGETLGEIGVYGRINGADEAWVIESEMQWLLDQPAETWLARRLLPFEPGEVAGISFERDASGELEDLVLARSDDGFWRVVSGARPALLSTDAVENKLGRLLWARLDPLIEREKHGDPPLQPSVILNDLEGQPQELRLLGECPGHPDRLVVDRGPGLRGCLPAELFEPWVLFDEDGGMVEGRLVPHRYGRIVRIELLGSTPGRSLFRRSGLWLLDAGEGQGSVPVDEDEVARWYGELARVEVEAQLDETPPEPTPPEGDPPAPQPPAEEFVADVELAIHADTGEVLRIRCRTHEGESECIRDEPESAAGPGGPRLRVLGALPRNLAFDAETFAARRLIEAGAGEVRELEILAGEAEGAVRQSVEQDMGVWRLDAPEHVDESGGALDEVRLETLLAILSSLRAEVWREPSSEPSLRRFQLDLVPEQGPRRTIALSLYPDCVVEIDGRWAAIAAADCAVLGEDLLFDDPLRLWIDGARSMEIIPGVPKPEVRSDKTFLRRQHGRFEKVDGSEADEATQTRLQSWIDWRSAGLRSGDPPTPIEWSVDIRRNQLPDVHAEIGRGWVRLRGADWYYVEREAKPVEQPEPTEPVDFDPEAIEIP